MFHLNLRLGVRDSHKGSPADYDPNLIPRWHFSWYLVKLLINYAVNVCELRLILF